MKFDRFQKAYDDAILYIQQSIEPGKYEPHMNKLVQWMLETDANPYGYLPHSFAGMVETAEGFMRLNVSVIFFWNEWKNILVVMNLNSSLNFNERKYNGFSPNEKTAGCKSNEAFIYYV